MFWIRHLQVLFALFWSPPKGSDVVRQDNMVKFLRKARQVLKEGEAYRNLMGLLEDRYQKNNFRPDDIQDLCNLLYDFPGLLGDLSQLLPPENTFALSDDFDLTRVVNVLADGQVLHRLATFGLMHIDARSGEYMRADEHVLHLLKSCFVDRNREEALITLIGGDAQRALSQMQEFIDSRDRWRTLTDSLPQDDRSAYCGKFWKRTRRLLIKLAVRSDQLPPSLELTGVKINPNSVRCGGFSDIYQAEYQGEKVAVKRLRIFSSSPRVHTQALREVLYQEVLVWRQLHHPRILHLVGIDSEIFRNTGSKHCIVVSWAHHGNIRECISNLTAAGRVVPYERWVLEIAEGLLFLHQEDVIHGDLRGTNVLIGKDYGVLLADFGLSDLGQTHTTSYGMALPQEDIVARWTAPERLVDGSELGILVGPNNPVSPAEKRHFATDIYSFGCLCVEIYENDAPQFEGISPSMRGTGPAVEEAVRHGRRPQRPATLVSEGIWNVIERCWSQKPQDRPSAQELDHLLRSAVE